MNIKIATSEHELLCCFAVMRELRPQLDETTFVSKVRNLEQSGYLLAYLQEHEEIVSVAGFRLGESLAWGRYLYIDDLVTRSNHRSRGFGSRLLSWLTTFAEEQGCDQLHLDSGVQRKDAHRFYQREGMPVASYHFAKSVSKR